MTIWVDADACPVAVREILFRAAQRTGEQLVFVANQYIPVPRSPNVRFQQVEQGFDVADNAIAQAVQADDLVITSDIPLAAEVIEKEALALSARGEVLTKDNVKARLNMRDFMDTLRASGVQTGGAAPLNQADRKEFANQLDRYLAKRRR